MLIWNDSCSIGIDIIDAQHKHLFEIGNQAYALLKNGLQTDKYDDVNLIVEDLRNYTKYHFKCEEEYMLKINYPGYEEQKREHTNFIKRLEEINLNNVDTNHQEYIEDLLHFVFEWILEHILEKDKLIMPV
ncbi:hemerythrin family protein [Clostridium bowmanii]|uniref:bacteriohemerythrin n=1 Tax=Clostridium bowmanii TaxID=132925 RepID=UPI001C0C4700|nr:hemerythrin family protein [Clostridium bowmanii]MBU3188277.1 hemerythrin family protein [Clostridium bowmanii]MCA1072664.1 hemerythrin family protein [Clostridium bowmanii]